MFIDLIRHGEVDGVNCFRGSTDDPLSSTGFAQMASALNNHPADFVISSPLQRCSVFAKKWCLDNKRELIIEPQFQEINFGDWEGLTSEQVSQRFSLEFQSYWQDPSITTPRNGESFKDFKQRVFNAWQALIKIKQHQHILVITHGGVIKSIVAEVLSIPPEKILSIETPHAAITRIRIMQEDENIYTSLVNHAVNLQCID